MSSHILDKAVGLGVAVVVASVVGYVSGSKREKVHSDEWRRQVERSDLTLHRLDGVRHLIEAAKGSWAEEPPTKLAEVITWLKEHDCIQEWEVKELKFFEDAWGRPVVLMCRDGKLIGLGSCGADGAWNGGHGDDLMKIIE